MEQPPSTPVAQASVASSSRSRLVRLLARLAGATLVLVVPAILLVAASLRTPSWWPDETSSNNQTRAEELENAAIAQLSSARRLETHGDAMQSEPWSFTIDDDDANAWLRTRLRDWLRHRGIESRLPDGVEGVGIATTQQGARLGARLSTGQIVWLVAGARVDDHGAIWIEPRGAGIGRTRLPFRFVLSRLDTIVSEETASALRGERPILQEGVVSVDEARRVRLLSVELRDGESVITVRTEARRVK